MRLFPSIVGAALLAAVAAPALAQSGEVCSGFKWAVDREQTAFAGEGIPTIARGGQIPGVMEAVTVQLTAQDQLRYEVAPSHKPKSNPAHGGIFPVIPIAVSGVYQVTISDAAWIDVVQNGKLLRQTGFTDSKDCRSVRKSVRFEFAKGPATIEISDAATEALKLEILPPPVE